MPRLRLLLAAVLFACAAPAALAQQAIEQQMTADEFRAAGLDKLSAAELANLNRWLQGQVRQETASAREQAHAEGREQARQEAEAASAGRSEGMFASGSREAVRSNIVGEFSGFGRGFRYTLANGQVWEQTDSARLDGVQRTDPAVTISPGMLGSWQLRIDGYNTRARVQRVN